MRVGGAGGEEKPLWHAAKAMSDRLISIFTRGADGRRPCHGRREKFQTDPHWRDLILFYEYFHGDTGEGLGASHQTGWTGLVASLIDEWRKPPQESRDEDRHLERELRTGAGGAAHRLPGRASSPMSSAFRS